MELSRYLQYKPRVSSQAGRKFSKSVLKFWSGLRCDLGRFWLNREETFADVFFQDTE